MAKKILIVLLFFLLFRQNHSLAQRVSLTLHYFQKRTTFTEKEVSQAQLFLEKNLGTRANETWSFKTIKALRDGSLIDNIHRVLAVGGKKELPIHIHFDDKEKIWPCSEENRVIMSEWGLAQSCRNKEEIKAMLIHEAAHITCPSIGLVYYPKLRHTSTSLLTPALSFHEGWANYWTALYSKKMLVWRNAAFTSFHKLHSNGKREKISGSRLKLRHYLCNSVTVGNLLWDLACLPKGYEGMIKALRLAWKQKAPTVVDLLSEYVYLYPEERSTVLELLRNRTRNCGSKEQYANVLNGTLFLFCERNKLPE